MVNNHCGRNAGRIGSVVLGMAVPSGVDWGLMVPEVTTPLLIFCSEISHGGPGV